MKPAESFVEQPVRSLQTMLRVISEDDNRMPKIVPDGMYGPTTMQAISAFQRLYGLPVTGITNQETWEKIVCQYERANNRINKAEPIEILLDPGQVFRVGDSNGYIYLLQSILTYLSQEATQIDPPEHSGIFDDTTAKALAAFQLLAGLPPTGQLDKITWKFLSKHFTRQAHRDSAVKFQ